MSEVATYPIVSEVLTSPTIVEVSSQGLPGIPGPPGPPGSTPYLDLPTIATNGQTVFGLSRSPLLPSLSTLYLNGVKATYGTDYLIDLAVLTWLRSTLTLQINDILELYYQ